jgi:bacteriocin biosynthesis cyclodehydratase domain-containing protein
MLPPTIKRGVSVLHRKRRDGNEVNFYFPASSHVRSCLLNEEAFRCLRQLDGNHTVKEIASHAKVTESSVRALIRRLEKLGVIAYETKHTGSDNSLRANQLNFLGDFERLGLDRSKMQARIVEAKVCIIGLGGVGSWVAYSLALTGVREIKLIDPDKVETGNLSQQALYRKSDVGRQKAERLARYLKVSAPDTTLHALNVRVQNARQLSRLIKGCQLVINCADEPEVDILNRIVSRSCYPRGIPHILCGGYDGHLSFLGPTVIPGATPCWFCYEKKISRQKEVAGLRHIMITDSDRLGGSIAPVAAITANYHAMEAFKVLSGWASPALAGRIAELNFIDFSITFTHFRRNPKCALCKRR